MLSKRRQKPIFVRFQRAYPVSRDSTSLYS